MSSDYINEIFQDNPVINSSIIDVHTELQFSGMIERIASLDIAEIDRITGFQAPKAFEFITAEVLAKYYKTIIWMRVNYVNNQLRQEYRTFTRRVCLPILVHQICLNIGTATDLDFSLRFVPITKITNDELLSPEDVSRVSDLLFSIQNIGFKMVAGIPLDLDGELDFMAMQHIEGTVTSYKRSHPVFGFYASFFKQHKLNSITGTLHRIQYGYEQTYSVAMSSVIRSIYGVER